MVGVTWRDGGEKVRGVKTSQPEGADDGDGGSLASTVGRSSSATALLVFNNGAHRHPSNASHRILDESCAKAVCLWCAISLRAAGQSPSPDPLD